MRPLHLSTFDQSGGAARAAWNLVQGLRDSGKDARMLVRDKTCSELHVVRAVSGCDFSKREHEASLIQRKLINPNRSSLSNTWFSLPVPALDVSLHPEVAAADVLHLHWVSGFLSPGALRQLIRTGKPVLWSLHDQRPFTGGCHFSAGCQGYTNNCTPCPQLDPDEWHIAGIAHAEATRQIEAARLTVICPSLWMADCARKSTLLSQARIEVVPYAVQTEIFQPRASALRAKLGLPKDEIVLLTGADHAGELRKGLGLLDAALRQCFSSMGAKVRLLVFGASEPPQGFAFPATWLGRINSPEELAELYSAADAFLLPSAEDNLPNTMLEALCCGTPVIAFNIGGVPDAVQNGRNGLLAAEVASDAYAAALSKFCANTRSVTADRYTIAASAREQFSIARQAETCLALYRELLAGRAENSSRAGAPSELPLAAAPESSAFAADFRNLYRAATRQRWKGRVLKIKRGLGLARAEVRDEC